MIFALLIALIIVLFIRIRRGDPDKPVMLRLKDEARSMYSGVAGLSRRYSDHLTIRAKNYYDNAGVAYAADGDSSTPDEKRRKLKSVSALRHTRNFTSD